MQMDYEDFNRAKVKNILLSGDVILQEKAKEMLKFLGFMNTKELKN